MVQHSDSGVDVLVAPTRSVEAAAVVMASTSTMLPVLSALDHLIVIADGGRMRGSVSSLVQQANVVVVAHRQHAGSSAAAALGIERVADLTVQLATRSIPTVIALIGSRPYTAQDVADFVNADVVAIADDPWSASVIAGRAGSAVRFRRSPLMRSLRELTGIVSARLRPVVANDDWSFSFDDPSVERR
jgi:hypothetical protein